MIHSSDIPDKITTKVEILAATPDELLKFFSPMERAVIIALKKMVKKERKATDAATPSNNPEVA